VQGTAYNNQGLPDVICVGPRNNASACSMQARAESQIRDDRSTASDKNRRGNHMTRTDTPVVCGNAATHAGARNGHQDSTLENIESSEWKGTNHVQYAWGNTTKRAASYLKPHLTDVTSGHPGTSAETTEDCGKQTVPARNVGLEKRWRLISKDP
jgi:hypothetical protein